MGAPSRVRGGQRATHAAVSCRGCAGVQAGVMLQAHQAALRVGAGGGGRAPGAGQGPPRQSRVRRRREDARQDGVVDALRWACGRRSCGVDLGLAGFSAEEKGSASMSERSGSGASKSPRPQPRMYRESASAGSARGRVGNPQADGVRRLCKGNCPLQPQGAFAELPAKPST